MKKYAIIVAGGIGSRMGADIPKQFLTLKGKPILAHTLEVFYEADPEIDLIVTLPTEQIPYWNELTKELKFKIPHQVVAGGETRFHSVKNGLGLIKVDQSLVAVHDGVRPMIDIHTINKGYIKASKEGCAITAVELKDSIRHITDGLSKSVDRKQYKIIQTPQIFDTERLKKAYRVNYKDIFTDDASVYEASGNKIFLIEGNYENIKITTPEDIAIAETLLNRRNKK